jgi:SNF2 family DNA or RNA helicase
LLGVWHYSEFPDVQRSAHAKNEKKKKKKKRVQNSDDDDDSGNDYLARKKKGPLFKIAWFRAILDEAHNVRNRRTVAARAVLSLDVLHPWILTGT